MIPRRVTSLLLLAGALLASPVFAAPSAASFFQTPAANHVELSPKGGYVTMVTTLPGGASVLTVHDTADTAKYKHIIRTSNEEVIIAVHWINENRVGFTIKNRRIEFNSNLDEMAADRDGGNLTHLITGNLQHQQEATGSFIASKLLTSDYAFFDVLHDGSDDILLKKYFWNNIDPAPDHARLYRLNTRTRQLRGLEGTQPTSALEWLADNHGVPRVAVSQRKGRCITAYRPNLGGEWRELDNDDCIVGKGFSPAFFDGDDTLYVQANHKGYGALFRYDLKTMKTDAEPIVSVPGFDYRGEPVIDYASRRLVGLHLYTDAGTTYWMNPALKAEQAKIDAMLTTTTNSVFCAEECLTAPVLLVVASSDRQPKQYIIYHRDSGKMDGLGYAHPDIKAAEMGLRDFHRFTASDGRSIPAYVTLPPGKASGPRPTVVLVHGGPAARGAYWDWEREAQFLATRGYVVIQPEFRGGTGFGADHFNAGLKQWGMAMQTDLVDAAQWAVKQGWADPKRIGIMGASYGSYATLMGLIQNPEVFRCGVEWAGVTDIDLLFSTSYSDASQENLKYGMRTLIGDPDNATDAARFRQYSPLLRAAELKQPLLMAHGLEDRRVPIVHATRFYDAVKRSNPNVELITYPNEGHGWSKEETSIAFWQRVETFLDKNLKQAP
ncbi:alpha/beta hydrolase family protein [Duganella margarita]